MSLPNYVAPPLTARITIAWSELCLARREDPARELPLESMLNRLLDQHANLLRASGAFKALEVIDPELAERLAPPAPAIRYVPERRGQKPPLKEGS